MILSIDRESDAPYLELDESLSSESQEIAPGLFWATAKTERL